MIEQEDDRTREYGWTAKMMEISGHRDRSYYLGGVFCWYSKLEVVVPEGRLTLHRNVGLSFASYV